MDKHLEQAEIDSMFAMAREEAEREALAGGSMRRNGRKEVV